MNCERCGSAKEAGDLRCPVCYLATPQAADGVGSTRVQIFRCKTCGAAMEYSARAQAPECAFCGSVLKLEQQRDPVEQTEQYIPFRVDRRGAVDVCRRWLSHQGFFQPSNLASTTRLESMRALWWVGWVVNAEATVTWTVDSNAGARRASWAPHAGEFRTAFDDVVIPATRGLSAAECQRLIPSYALAGGGELLPATADAVRERFETSRSVARGRIVEGIQRLAETRVKGQEAPGTSFRNFHASVLLSKLRTRRVAFPAYAVAYRYRGRLYRTVISGQDPTCVIGQAPLSGAKIVLVAMLVLAGLAAAAIGVISRII